MRKTLLIILCLTALAAAAHKFANQQEPAEKNEEIEVFRIGLNEQDIFNFGEIHEFIFHPHYTRYIPFVFDTLSEILDSDSNKSNFNMLDNGRECVISLPKGIKFHDGTEFTADDVIYSLSLQKKALIQSNPFQGIYYIQDLEINKLDNYKVVLRNFNSKVDIKQTLSEITVITKNQHLALKHNGMSIYMPYGTGPFTFSSFDLPKKTLSLKRNNSYHSNPPFIKKLEIQYFENREAATMALFRDMVDFVPVIGNVEHETFRNSQHILYRYPLNYCYYLLFNLYLPKYQNAYVRKALSLAIDRQALIDAHLGLRGSRIATSTFLNTSFPPTEPTAEPQDKQEAIRLFQKAGYNYIDGKLMKNGEQLSIVIGVTDLSSTEYAIPVARLIGRDWENIGINAQIKASSVLEIKNGNFDILLTGVLEKDVITTLDYLFSQNKKMGFGIPFSDKRLDTLIESHQQASQKEAILRNKMAIQERLKETIPLIPLFYDQGASALSQRYSTNVRLKNILIKDPTGLSFSASASK